MEIKPVAYIKTDFTEKFGIPRQSGRVEKLIGRIYFYPEYQNPDFIRGLEDFSHIWLLFDFSESHRDNHSPTVRPPRLGGNKRTGVFASRSPFRPNSLGLSCVKLEKIEKNEVGGCFLEVSGVDMLDMTPIYDIKPYIPYTDSRPDARGSFADEFSAYRLEVDFPRELLERIPEEKRDALICCLSEDPRPSYITDDSRIFKMKYDEYDVHFKVTDQKLTVENVLKNNNKNF